MRGEYSVGLGGNLRQRRKIKLMQTSYTMHARKMVELGRRVEAVNKLRFSPLR